MFFYRAPGCLFMLLEGGIIGEEISAGDETFIQFTTITEMFASNENPFIAKMDQKRYLIANTL